MHSCSKPELLGGKYSLSVALRTGLKKKRVVVEAHNPMNTFTTSPCSKYHQGLSILVEKYLSPGFRRIETAVVKTADIRQRKREQR